MRIALFYNRDIYAHLALNLLTLKLSEHSLGFFYSEHVGTRVERDNRLQKLAEFEKSFDTLPGNSFEKLAKSANSVEYAITDINGVDAEKLTDFKPDLVVSIRFGQIFQASTISISRLGVINLHSGLLPDYKGVMASFWSLLNGASELGTTLHWITDNKIDSGEIISRCTQPVRHGLTYSQQVRALYEPGVEQIVRALGDIESIAKRQKKNLPDGHYYSFPETKHLDAFEESGWKLY